MRYQTAKYQAKNSPSKIEGAGGSMMISSNSPSSFAVSLVFMLPPKSVCQKWGLTYNITSDVFVQGRYTLGLSSVFEWGECKNGNAQIAIGYRF